MKTPSDSAATPRVEFKAPALLERLARIVLLAAIILVPTVFWLRFADNFEVPKLLIFRALVLFLWLITLALPKWRRLLWQGPAVPGLVAIVVCMLASWLTSGVFRVGWSGEEGSWMGVSSGAVFILAAVAAGPWLSGRMIGKLAAGVLAAAIILSAYAFMQLAGWEPVSWNPEYKSGHWIFAMLGNPVHLANYLTCAFWLSLCMFPFGSRSAWLLRAVFLAGILATRQESALAALALGGCAYLLVCRRKKLAVAAAPAILAILVILGLGKGTLGARPQIWEGAARLLRASPILGIGPDLFYSRFPHAAEYAYFVAEPPIISGSVVRLRLPASAHNEPIGLAAGVGVVGLGIYIWVILAAVRVLREPRILPAVLGLWVVHLVNPPSMATASLFWILLAILARPAQPRPAGPRWLSGFLAASAAAAVFASAFFGLRLVVTQAYRHQVNKLEFFGEVQAVAEELDRWSGYAARLHPGQIYRDALLLDSLRKGKDTERLGAKAAELRVIELAWRARAGNPYNIFYSSALASFELNRGRERGDAAALARSEELLRRLRMSVPAALSLNDDLAEVLEAQGRGAEALELKKLREKLDVRGVFRPGLPVP